MVLGLPIPDWASHYHLPKDQTHPHFTAHTAQAVQLKSFAQRKSDGQLDRFVALLVPSGTLPAGPDSGALSARQLQGDYEWVREYDSSVRYDDKREERGAEL